MDKKFNFVSEQQKKFFESKEELVLYSGGIGIFIPKLGTGTTEKLEQRQENKMAKMPKKPKKPKKPGY